MDLINNYGKQLLAVILSLLAFAGGRIFENKKFKKQSDIENYKFLVRKLPKFEEIKNFFTEYNLIGEFPKKPFFDFYEGLDGFLANPENHFHNSKLQKSLLEVMEIAKSMEEIILHDTWSVPNFSDQLVIRSRKYGSDSDDIKTGKKLNQFSSDLFEKYTAFLKMAKKTLIVTNLD